MIKIDFSRSLLIQSVTFKDVFLRMGGNRITQANGAGVGKVSYQKSTSPTKTFKIQEQRNDTFTIESVKCPGVFLRMDGSGVRDFAGSDAGHINCQFGASDWEHFKLHEQNNGSYTIESVAFPNVSLRMDENNRSAKEEDFGTVNCQYGASTCRRFYLLNTPETGKVKNMFNKFAKQQKVLIHKKIRSYS